MNDAIPNLSTVVMLPPANVSTGESELDSARVEARKHLQFFDWVLSVKGEYLGYGAEGIIYIFLFEIEPGRSDIPGWIWVIGGDVPPTYIPADDTRTLSRLSMVTSVRLKTGSMPRVRENPWRS